MNKQRKAIFRCAPEFLGMDPTEIEYHEIRITGAYLTVDLKKKGSEKVDSNVIQGYDFCALDFFVHHMNFQTMVDLNWLQKYKPLDLDLETFREGLTKVGSHDRVHVLQAFCRMACRKKKEVLALYVADHMREEGITPMEVKCTRKK